MNDDAIMQFAKREALSHELEFLIRPQQGDGFQIKKEGNKWQIIANNSRSCLWGVYQFKKNESEGVFRPDFDIRGINPCESLLRHTPQQLEKLICRMAHWRMNTLIVHIKYGYPNMDISL